MTSATDWLKKNRCPWCANERKCKGYKMSKTYDGWRCYGYRSKYGDERWMA